MLSIDGAVRGPLPIAAKRADSRAGVRPWAGEPSAISHSAGTHLGTLVDVMMLGDYVLDTDST